MKKKDYKATWVACLNGVEVGTSASALVKAINHSVAFQLAEENPPRMFNMKSPYTKTDLDLATTLLFVEEIT